MPWKDGDKNFITMNEENENRFEETDWDRLKAERPDLNVNYYKFRTALREGKLDKLREESNNRKD